MPRPAALLLAALLLPTTAAAGQTPAEFDAAWRALSDHFQKRVVAEEIVGASLAFVDGGRLLALETVGSADLASGRPVDRETIYHWASITKTFTAIALMQLRDRGLVSLDDPVVRYLPELRRVHNPYGPMDAVTLRQLLSHSAGFRGATWPWGGDRDWHPHEPTTWEQLVAMMPYTEIVFEPGSRYSYSNPGIVFIGRVIEEVTGEPFETYVEKNILRPLGMATAYFDRTPWHLLPHRSNSYYRDADGLRANGLDFDTGITVSNGGLNASVPDMARYAAFLAGAPGSPEGILSRESLAEMWTPQIPVGEEDGLQTAMGLAFFLEDRDGHRFVGHTGGQMGFVSFLYVDPASGAGAIAAFNTLGAGTPPHPDTRGLLADIRGRLFDGVFPLFRDGSR